MKFVSCLLLSTVLTGCTVLAPDYDAPKVEAGDWRGAEVANEVSVPPADEIPANFWGRFGNSELSDLVGQALSDNNDVRAAVQRVEQARAATLITSSSLLPGISAVADAGRDFTRTRATSSYSVGAQVNYELDLFGRNQLSVAASKEAEKASAYDRDAIALIASSDTAQAFIALLSLDDRLAVASQNIDNAREVLRITQARYDVGTLSALELAQQKTALANTEAQVAALRQQRDASQNQLAVLVGKPPQDFSVKSTTMSDFTLPSVAPLQPSELVLRRPDVRVAEAQLQAANYDIGAARAAFFPSINLSAVIALGANPASSAAKLSEALAASATQPIFRGGALLGGERLTEARRAELEENYKKAVLVSFQEVQDALAAEVRSREQVSQLTTASQEAERAYGLVRQRFDAGAVDFLTLLDAQRSLFTAQDALITARQQQFAAVIDLYKALGGGWKES